jgi:hypothetical protein
VSEWGTAMSEKCRAPIRSTVPSWAGEDQIDPCLCALHAGHDGRCLCAHDIAEER